MIAGQEQKTKINILTQIKLFRMQYYGRMHCYTCIGVDPKLEPFILFVKLVQAEYCICITIYYSARTHHQEISNFFGEFRT